jgi:hypothetical protein
LRVHEHRSGNQTVGGRMSEEKLNYDVEYGEEFREQVLQGDVNPLCGLRITVENEDLAGAPNGEYHIDDYLFYHFRKVASSVLDVLEGERREVQLYNVADYLVFEPTNGYVFVSLQSPQQLEANRGDSPVGPKISKEGLSEGISDAVEEFHSSVVEVNSSLSDNEHLCELLEIAETVRNTTES